MNVKYVVVGGHAVAFHGHPRFTGDIDFFVEATPDNAERIEQVLVRFGFESIGLTARDFLDPGMIVQLGVPPNRIDLITSIDAVDFGEAWDSRVEATLDGVPAHVLSKELLLRNKQAVGRARDLADCEELADSPPGPAPAQS